LGRHYLDANPAPDRVVGVWSGSGTDLADTSRRRASSNGTTRDQHLYKNTSGGFTEPGWIRPKGDAAR